MAIWTLIKHLTVHKYFNNYFRHPPPPKTISQFSLYLFLIACFYLSLSLFLAKLWAVEEEEEEKEACPATENPKTENQPNGNTKHGMDYDLDPNRMYTVGKYIYFVTFLTRDYF